MNTSFASVQELIDFGIELVAAADRLGIIVRLLGSVAIALRCRENGFSPATQSRQWKDVDLICGRSDYAASRELLLSQGFQCDPQVEVVTEGNRAIFRTNLRPYAVDLFVDVLDFCHRLPLRDRLRTDSLTIPLADLLLSKLQRIDPRPDDILDIVGLLGCFPSGESDGARISLPRIFELLSKDWGFCETVVRNLAVCELQVSNLGKNLLTTEQRAHVARRCRVLREAIEGVPKTLRWRLRSIVGARVRWYRVVESADAF